MVKFKAKTKDCHIFVKAKISSNEEISAREIDIFSKKCIRGFLKPKQIKKNVIEYSGPTSVSLYEHLKKPISKYEFFYIMAQIVDCTHKIEKNNLFLDKLILDLRYVYINETTKEIQLIYFPVISNHICVDVIGFMESIIYSVKSEQNTDYISRYFNYIKSLNAYDPSNIESYISAEDRDIANLIKKRNVGQSGFITDKPGDYYKHYEDTDVLDEEVTGLLDEEENEATGLLNEDDGTTLLGENDETTIFSDVQSNYENIHFASLFRVLTEETIILNKPVFRIGKEKSYVDYFVSNNNAISRSHADIITRGNRYFVYDHNSTNHTYINESIIPIKVETEIFDGNTIRFANEKFIFNV